MIGTVLSAAQASQGMSSEAGWNPSPKADHASDTHLAEPNVVITDTGQIPTPTVNRVPRSGFPGLRAITQQLVRTGIPRLPYGPPKVSRMGQGFNGPRGRTPKPISVVQQYAPAPTAEQAGDWWEYLR